MVKAKLFEIECITNMQVGTGETNVDIVDIKVERDRGVPCIYSSSLKGALRENYENVVGFKEAEELFGNKDNDGKLKFLQAFLITMPMRVSYGDKNYVNVCNSTTINHINKNCEFLGIESPYPVLKETEGDKIVGNKGFKVEGIECVDGETMHGAYVANDRVFSLVPLPIQTRNNLDPKHRNLWYEEYVPYGSKFAFIVIGEENDIEKLERSFGTYVQIGGNSSLGFGLCKIREV